MTVLHRIAASCAALALGALAFSAVAAEPVTWPVPWKPGQTWRYDSELFERETNAGETEASRITDITEIAIESAIESADRGGFVQVWTSRRPQVETIEGDRAGSDMMAAMLGALEGFPAEAEFDAEGRYRRLRNIDALTAKIGEAMAPAAAMMAEGMAAEFGEALDEAQRTAMIAEMRETMQAKLRELITPASIEAISGSEIGRFSAFVGTTLQPGKRYRDRVPLYTPVRGHPLPAEREYRIEIDRRDPAYARLRWTYSVDTRGDADALWALVADLTTTEREEIDARGRPRDLSLRHEGFALFRRDTGAIELFENVETARYGDAHASERRTRMRREGAARTWAEEEAAGAAKPDARR